MQPGRGQINGRKWTIASAIAIAGALVVLLLSSAVANAARDPLPNKIKGQVARALTAQGFKVKQILPCRKQGPTKYRCEWRVEGTYTDGPKYSCSGFATYFPKRKTRKLVLDTCPQEELWDLLIGAGLKPTAILNGKFEKGVYSFEWRAEGTREGGVPYRCKDVAKYTKKTKEWDLGGCANELEEAEPLLPEDQASTPIFGFNDDWIQQGKYSRLGLATDIGTQVIRFVVDWSIAEPQPNVYNFGPYDVVIQDMLAAGVRPFFVPLGTPCWAQGEGNRTACSSVVPPDGDHLDDYADFMGELAARYPQAFAIEIWNEPNWEPYYAPKPNAAFYARMVREAAARINQLAPDIPIVTAGLSPLANSQPDGSRIAFDQFLREVFDAGGIGPHVDAIGTHVYFGDVDDHALNMRQQIGRLRKVMSANGAGSLPIWVTEYGISSTEETDEDGQARILVELYNTFRRLSNIPVVIVHRFFESETDIGQGIDHRGIVRANGDPKPAYCALGRAVGTFPSRCN